MSPLNAHKCNILTRAAFLESCINMTEINVMLLGFLELDSSL